MYRGLACCPNRKYAHSQLGLKDGAGVAGIGFITVPMLVLTAFAALADFGAREGASVVLPDRVDLHEEGSSVVLKRSLADSAACRITTRGSDGFGRMMGKIAACLEL